MPQKDGSFTKTQRMNKIAAHIAPILAKGEKVNNAKLVAWIEVNIGLTRQKAGEYIDTLISAYDWEFKDGNISLGFCEAV